MRDLYGTPGKKYLALLLFTKLTIFLSFIFYILLFVLKLTIFPSISPLIITTFLCFFYITLALLIGMLWEGLSGAIFRLDLIEWNSFYRNLVIPLLIICVLGATYSSYTILCYGPYLNVFLFLLLVSFIGALIISIILCKVIKSIRWSKRWDKDWDKNIDEIKELYGQETTKRLELSINLLRGRLKGNPLPSSRGLMCVGLESKPWHAKDMFPWSISLEKNYKKILQEALQLTNDESYVQPYIYPGIVKGRWDSIGLILNGSEIRDHCEKCPNTMALLKLIPGYPHFREAIFSILQPGAQIKPHRDYSNVYLTYHLGLMIPEQCGIRVGGEERCWKEGKSLFFDTSYEHEAWNNSNHLRLILLVDFFHFDLTAAEKNFFSKLGL